MAEAALMAPETANYAAACRTVSGGQALANQASGSSLSTEQPPQQWQ